MKYNHINSKLIFAIIIKFCIFCSLYSQQKLSDSDESLNYKAIDNFTNKYKNMMYSSNISNEKVQKYINEIIDPNYCDINGRLPLEYALYTPQVFKMLLEKGAKVDLLWKDSYILVNILNKIKNNHNLKKLKLNDNEDFLYIIDKISSSSSAELNKLYHFKGKKATLVEITEFYEFSRIKELVIANGAIEKQDSYVKVPLINLNNIPEMSCVIKKNESSTISEGLIDFEINPSIKYAENELPLMQETFIYNDLIKKKYQIDDYFFTIFNDIKFYPSTNIILIWNVINDSLKFKTILNGAVFKADAEIKEITKFSDDKYTILGRTKGADEGDNWGSIWFGIWDENNDLEIISTREWYNQMYDKQVQIDATFDSSNMKLIYKHQLYDNSNDSFELNKTEEVNLKEIYEF